MEDLAHFLLPIYPAPIGRTKILLEYMKTVLGHSEHCLLILDEMLTGCEDDHELWIQFVLDCSVFPSVIAAAQKDPAVLQLLFRATRTWCYSLHRTRLKLLGRWFS